MSYRLFLNELEVNLNANPIAQTKQLNTIGKLNDRQSNFTPRFVLPETDWNRKILTFLGVTGNTSEAPYIKLNATLFDENLALIRNGWCLIKSSGNGYEVFIYDGLIDFYKAIENRTITDAGLEELNHLKTLASVAQTWTDLTIPYRYNVADYNGKMTYDVITPKLNVDYLIPSASVEFIFNKIFEYIGWTYEGSAFELENFKSLWLSYPKTIGDDTQSTTLVYQNNWSGQLTYFQPGSITPQYYRSLFGNLGGSPVDSNGLVGTSYNVNSPVANPTTLNNTYFTATEPLLVKIEVNGTFNGNGEIQLRVFVPGSGIVDPIEVYEVTAGQEVNIIWYANLDTGEAISMYSTSGLESGSAVAELSVVNGNVIDFEEAFIGMSITDFINEILYRFSLTPFPDTRNKHMVFLTHAEWLQSDNFEDWSDKFNSKDKETYILSGYAQRNRIAYKYNDKEADYNDGFLTIENKNIASEKTVIQSKIYSPEKEKTSILGNLYNVYKFWEKEVKDESSNVEYKPLENRFYLMKSSIRTQAITIGSELIGATQAVTAFAIENFSGLSFREIINEYYLPLYYILQRSKIVTCKFFLTPLDIHFFDFRKIIYVKQLAGYFIVNKIINYEKGALTACELISLNVPRETDDGIDFEIPKLIYLSDLAAIPPVLAEPWKITAQYVFMNYSPEPTGVEITATLFSAHPDDGGVATATTVTEAIDINENLHIFDTLFSNPILAGEMGWYEIFIEDTNYVPSIFSAKLYIQVIEAPPTPNIFVGIENPGGVDYDVPFYRDISYIFYNFTPAWATLTIQRLDWMSGIGYGDPNIVNLTALTADVTHNLIDVEIPYGFGNYRITVETDTITWEVDTFIW